MAKRSKAKEQQERVEIARNALIRLRSGRTFRRRDLFEHPDYEVAPDAHWVTTLLHRMQDQGLIVGESPPGARTLGRNKEYSAVNPDAFEAILDDPTNISRLLWPAAGANAEVPPEVAPEQSADDLPAADEPATGEGDVSALTVKFLGAMLENTIYLRERVAALEARVNEWDPLIRDMAQTLNTLK